MRPHEMEFTTLSGSAFTDLFPIQFGHETNTPGRSFGPVQHSHYLFYYILEGAGSFTIHSSENTGKIFELSRDMGFLIFPSQIAYYIADFEDPWEYIWLEFDGTHVKPELTRLGFSPNSPIFESSSPRTAEELICSMQRLLDHHDESPLFLVGCTYLFFDAFRRSAKPYRALLSQTTHGYSIDMALAYIEENYQRDISVEDIARYVGLNRSYFGKLFKDTMGASPQRFLMGYRMEHACDLLRLTARSIGEVGQAVGYPNQLHFSRAFKNYFGVSPRAWRQKHVLSTPASTC